MSHSAQAATSEYLRGRASAAAQLEAEAAAYESQFPNPGFGTASYVAPGLLRDMACLIRDDE